VVFLYNVFLYMEANFGGRNMKKLAILITICNLTLYAYAKYSGGNGEPNNPYLIATPEDLNAVSEDSNDWSKHFLMTSDINMAGYTYNKAPIAPDITNNPSFYGTRFTGVFDGNNHTISLLVINGGNNDYIGLFGSLDKGAKVLNLRIEDANISGIENIGILCGEIRDSESILLNCHVSGFVKGGIYLGGLCGINNNSAAINCYAEVSVRGVNYLGVMCGLNNGGTIINSFSKGSVSGNRYLGGLCGRNDSGDIGNCSSECPVSGALYLGGLCGENSGILNNCCATGPINADSYIGGLCGRNYHNIVNCYATGPVNGNTNIGGLCGSSSGTVSDSFWDTETSGIATSHGGIGKTTIEMQTKSTFTDAGWDFTGETVNGTSSVWTIEPNSYPVITLFDMNSTPYEFDGDGTQVSPYLIYDANDLGEIWQKPTCYYELVNDINLAGIQWSIAVVQYFRGSFEGNNKIISNLTISGNNKLGLFGNSLGNGSIINLGLKNIHISGNNGLGGLCGGNASKEIYNCYSTGSVEGSGSLGGLCGSNSGNISNCHSACSVSGTNNLGGLCGGNSGTISNCYATGAINGGNTLGGLCGNSNRGNIDGCYATGSVNGSGELGGLCGNNYRGPINNCYATGSVNGSGELGGLCGNNGGGDIINCHAEGDVAGLDHLGGLCGYNTGTITECSARGSVSGRNQVGGLCGDNERGDIEYCFATGSVNGNRNIGGLCGDNARGLVSNCYAMGSVSGADYAGGLCGNSRSADIINCYSNGYVTGDDDEIGGLCGNSNGTVSDCFWDIETSGKSTSDGGTGKTTVEMQTELTFTDAGWDFNTPIWEICPDTNVYPHLWWEYYCNAAPIAVAGPNQVVYICDENDFAYVTLDGSGSYDDDNDILDYYWSWYIDSNLYEANGVSPTIQLPAGEYEIELVVYDGIDESEPNYCTVTVVEPLRAKLFCTPRLLNTRSRRGTITAIVYMPQGITPDDIDANEPLVFICDSNEVESTRQFVFKWKKYGRPCTWVMASFDKDDCIDIMSAGLNRIKVVGKLNSGRCYYGNSFIYVFEPKPFQRLWKFPK
jgi:hypothetical protein